MSSLLCVVGFRRLFGTLLSASVRRDPRSWLFSYCLRFYLLFFVSFALRGEMFLRIERTLLLRVVAYIGGHLSSVLICFPSFETLSNRFLRILHVFSSMYGFYDYDTHDVSCLCDDGGADQSQARVCVVRHEISLGSCESGVGHDRENGVDSEYRVGRLPGPS